MDEFTLMIQDWLEDGKTIYLTGIYGQIEHMLQQSGVYKHLKGNGFVYESKSEVLEKLLD